ncbi:hypothetical protein A8H39_00325 [Paraburkholderia fungorum]|uniref:hypothetical protein n=1 Tax=Paraburkholderia fungorum TaxID=134537 RepID=UPI0004806C78|nr:hypothetical protein [Paraburkholderia fungorum]PNE59629.1 hypothetical protein A8H39_00325 [Paraburkholderia fungorum]
MFIVRNFFYVVGIAFLFGLQSVNPDNDVLRQFVLILQADNFWTVVKIGTLILCALEWSFSVPVSSTSALDDLKSLWDVLKKVATKFMPTRLGPAGGPDLGAGFPKGQTSEANHSFQPTTQGSPRASRTPAADAQKTDQPFTERETLVAKTLWNDSASFTIDDISDLTLRTSRQCARELVGMGLYPDLAAVNAEVIRRSKVRKGNG